MSITYSRPSGLMRFLLRLPIYMYKLKLGWLLDHRFLLLAHRGRKTGQVRQAVLEVIYYDRVKHESFVASGWGATTDWYRNIEAAPALWVQTGTKRYRPAQRFLTQDENQQVWSTFTRRHPIEARLALKLYGIEKSGTLEERSARLASSVRMVSFRPQSYR